MNQEAAEVGGWELFAGMTPEDRARVGITDDLVRVSVGIEDQGDLIEDFERALDGA